VLRKDVTIRHHIFSTLWSSAKNEFLVLKENSCRLVGDGKNIQLWTDEWCGFSLIHTLNIQVQDFAAFPKKVSDYIVDKNWCLPPDVDARFPILKSLMQHVTLPVDVTKDKLVWKGSADGELSAKIAYEFKRHHLPNLDWAKSIWCIDIPPSKSLITWRLMHDKLATDENLKLRGCSLPSICSLCSNYEESTFHLFFECSFSSSLWCWLASILNQTLNFQSIEDLWKLCDRGWNAQRKLVIKATIVNIIDMIWLARNNMRFNNKKTTWHSAIALI
jgi:hypothetical protein